MNIYRVIGDRIGTSEARELAQRLVAWHDAMVKHLRIVGSRPTPQCGEACPHEQAGVLWAAAQDIFGANAKHLDFLRSHGQRRRASTLPIARDWGAEMERMTDPCRFVVWPHHPDRLRWPAPSGMDACVTQALTWNIFRTAELLPPAFWLRRLNASLGIAPPCPASVTARVSCGCSCRCPRDTVSL